MCGFVGFIESNSQRDATSLHRLCRAMTDTLVHRGPDDSGVWTDPTAGVALGHRRLSIIDLSPAGHQPMVSASGRFVIVYNGEVYNFSQLRSELQGLGAVFRGCSDTEVIVEAIERWGIEVTVKRLIGMFAFALWDKRENSLWLARDRLGIKPLYWGQLGKTVVFSSELKALRQHPNLDLEIDRSALAAYLRFAYVPAPHSIYKGIRKLRPGTIVEIRSDETAHERHFWRMEGVVLEGRASRLSLTDAEATEQLRDLLLDAVGRRMVADVPLGAFLSGGIDSSTVVALMQAQSDRPIQTFSIGFDKADFNEAQHAKAVANHLGTDHTELYVNADQAQAVVPRLPNMYDEPFADSSQIPTFLISELTRRHVTVSLSGDGGDELFAGYNRYHFAQSLWRKVGWMPVVVRRAAAAGIKSVPTQAWTRGFAIIPRNIRPRQVGDKLHKLADILADGQTAFYRILVSQWDDPNAIVQNGEEYYGSFFDNHATKVSPDYCERMQYQDTITYLPDDILTKVDRASMAVSLEARVPLLDHRVVEFAWRLPKRFKYRGGDTKWLLRQVLYRHVPRSLVDRPKMGFGAPIDSWLRGPLRDWAEYLLGESEMRREGFLNPEPIRQRWHEHLSGNGNWQYPLWSVLMFQAWLRHQAENAAVVRDCAS